MTKDINKEIIDLLNNVSYWETCPESYKVRIEAVKKALIITAVSHRRKLLIAYELNVFKGKEQCSQEMAEEMVDKYLSNL